MRRGVGCHSPGGMVGFVAAIERADDGGKGCIESRSAPPR